MNVSPEKVYLEAKLFAIEIHGYSYLQNNAKNILKKNARNLGKWAIFGANDYTFCAIKWIASFFVQNCKEEEAIIVCSNAVILRTHQKIGTHST